MDNDEKDAEYLAKLRKVPVPPLDHTLQRLLEYSSVIGNEQERTRLSQLVLDFEENMGPKAQKRLHEMAEKENNWVNDFWMNDMYLKNRIALPLNSNPAYVFADRKFPAANDHIRFCAALVRGMYSFKDKIDRRALPQDTVSARDMSPLCMQQYWRAFTCYREPSWPSDVLHTKTDKMIGDNEHVLVMCANQCFILHTVTGGDQHSLDDIEYQLQEIVKMASNRCEISVVPISAFTTAHRDRAAEVLQILLETPENRTAMEWVQTSAFTLCLDKPTDFKITKDQFGMSDYESKLAHRAHHILHGFGGKMNGLNRWYDKSLGLIVTPEGLNGMLMEHSVAEGIVVINMVEHALDTADQLLKSQFRPDKEHTPMRMHKPKPLTWHLSRDAIDGLKQCAENFEKVSTDLEFNALQYHSYGKDYIKSMKCSPDAFIQIILQLAYYRPHKSLTTRAHQRLCSTYESASLRRFKHGRVDNIRAAHPQALKLAQVWHNDLSTADEKLAEFQTAIEKQTSIMIENITGLGIDNHIIALRDICADIAEETNSAMPELFSDTLYKEVMRFPLSTSQVTTGQKGAFLCYGPVVPDGYGCAYNLQRDGILFGISSFNSCEWTSAERYRYALIQILDEIQVLFDALL